MTLCVCAIHCIAMSIKKLQICSTNKHWGEKMNYFTLSYFIFRNLNFKIVRKWRGTHSVAYKLKTGWGSRNYLDLDIRSWSKEEIRVPSFHTARSHIKIFPYSHIFILHIPARHYHFADQQYRQYRPAESTPVCHTVNGVTNS